MRTINTSAGPVTIDPEPPRHIATTRIYDEDMHVLDEDPEIVSVVPAIGWAAAVGEALVPLVVFVALDDGRLYGVAVGNDGKVDLEDNIEKAVDFNGYLQTTHTNELQKENQHGL